MSSNTKTTVTTVVDTEGIEDAILAWVRDVHPTKPETTVELSIETATNGEVTSMSATVVTEVTGPLGGGGAQDILDDIDPRQPRTEVNPGGAPRGPGTGPLGGGPVLGER